MNAQYAGTVAGFTTGEFDADGDWREYPTTRLWVDLDDASQPIKRCRVTITEAGPADPDPAGPQGGGS